MGANNIWQLFDGQFFRNKRSPVGWRLRDLSSSIKRNDITLCVSDELLYCISAVVRVCIPYALK